MRRIMVLLTLLVGACSQGGGRPASMETTWAPDTVPGAEVPPGGPRTLEPKLPGGLRETWPYGVGY